MRKGLFATILAPIPVKDFLLAHRTVAEVYQREGGEHSMERTIGIIMQLFPSRKRGKMPAIMTRMHALMDIYDHPLMKPWKIEGSPDGTLIVSEAVFSRENPRHFAQ